MFYDNQRTAFNLVAFSFALFAAFLLAAEPASAQKEKPSTATGRQAPAAFSDAETLGDIHTKVDEEEIDPDPDTLEGLVGGPITAPRELTIPTPKRGTLSTLETFLDWLFGLTRRALGEESPSSQRAGISQDNRAPR